MSDRSPASDHPYHCATHGWWSAVKESGCPTCVVEARKRITELERENAELRARLATAEQQRDAVTQAKDGAYLERNQLVAALSKLFPSGIGKTAIEGWSEDWHGCVYIDLPTGQVSWHFHDSHAHLFAHLPQYQGKWDGHDTPEKYRRLSAIRAEKG